MEREGLFNGSLYYASILFSRECPGFFIAGFAWQVLHENLAAANGPDSPFACMVSVKDMVSITFYVTAKTKIYEPSENHLLFGRLFLGSHLSPMEHIGEKGELHYFDYINEESGIPFLHTTFIFTAGNRQILGHLNGEAQEWENLVRMRDKILNTVERGDFFERNES